MAGLFSKLKNKFSDIVSTPGTRDGYDEYDDEFEDDYDDYDDFEDSDSRYDSASRGRQYESSRDSGYRRNDYREERESPREGRQRLGEGFASSSRRTASSSFSRTGGPDILQFSDSTSKPLARPNVESIILRPKVVDDAVEICNHMRSGRMCIVDLTGLNNSNAQRIADYLGGVCHALDGVTTRVNEGIFTVAPHTHKVMSDYRDDLSLDSGFFSRAANDR